MSTRRTKIIFSALALFLFGTAFPFWAQADQEDLSAVAIKVQADWYKTYDDRIKALEERIRQLELELNRQDVKNDTLRQGHLEDSKDNKLSAKHFKEEIKELVREMEALRATFEFQRKQSSRIRLRGGNKIRLKNIMSTKPLVAGSYGEMLERGCRFNHRLVLEMEVKITDGLSAGGKIRLSNEGSAVFETGPEHLSSERGSAFVRYNTEKLRSTFGYYDVYLTPLTLMRWDVEDTPEGGGESGCACPGAGGAITAESLEELGPELIFEGVKLNAAAGEHIDLVALFARSRSAKEGQSYRQYTYGTRAKALIYHRPSTSFRWVGMTYIFSKDDKSSITFALYRPSQNRILSLDCNLPIGRNFVLRGEWALTESDEDLLSQADKMDRGYGIIGTMEVRYSTQAATRLSYLRMSSKYKSLYNALSYNSNREGFRVSSNYQISKGKFSLWAFYKRLRELEPAAEAKGSDLLESFSTLSFGVSTDPSRDLSIRSSCMLKIDRRDDDDSGLGIEKIDNKTQIMTGEVIYNFTRENSFTLGYQRIDHQDKVDSDRDYQADVVSTLFSTRF